MVQKITLRELSSIPPLFTFQERYLLSQELLRKDLYPPIPLWFRGSKEGEWIIWGKGLVDQLKDLNKQEVLVRRFGPDELTSTDALILWMGLEHREEEWDSYRVQELSALPTPLQTLVAELKLDLKTAMRVKSLPLRILEAFIPLLETFSYSQRRIFLRLFFEVFHRDQLDTMKGLELVTYLVSSPNPLEELHRIRYPEFHRLEQSYRATVDPILKGSGIQVSPPSYFEGTRFKVEFCFEKGTQLKKKAQILQKLSETIDSVINRLTHDAI
ncbi:MAG: hypothetical protein N2442_06490 [Spirochaetes bacterium]|nr:hypothetical protein [Spirochaetota bacterium]